MGQPRQSMYRDTQIVVEQIDGSRAEGEIDHLRQQLAEERARADVLAARLERAVEPSEELATRFASTAQAEGISLPVARRLLFVVMGRRTPSISSLGRKTAKVAEQSAHLLAVLDAEVRPRVRQAAADEFFWDASRS